jgi:MFS family permease
MTQVAPTGPGADRIITRNFIFIWIANFANFGAFYLLLTTLPLYLVEVGLGKSDIGLLIGIFSATAVVLRPLMGRVADVWGKKRVAVAGGLLLAFSFTLYPASTTLPLLLMLHILRGVGWGAFLAAAPALLADIVPVRRRGEAVGYYGVSNNTAMLIFPYMGVVLIGSFGFLVLFLAAAAVALVSVLSPILISGPPRQEVANPGPRPRFRYIETGVLFPMLILCLFTVAYGSVVTYLPLYSPGRGMENPGLFFIPFALVAMFSRGFAGRASDRFGRAATIVPGMVLAALALGILSRASSLPMFIGVAFVLALAFSLVQPALMALLIDRVRPETRGVSLGTFTAGFDLGIGIGSFMAGQMLELVDFPAMYQLIGLVPLVGVVVFILGYRRARRAAPGA